MRPVCVRSLLVVVTLVALCTPIHADPRGFWSTEGGLSVVEIQDCDEGLCGRIVSLDEPRDETGNIRVDKENPDPTLRTRPVEGIEILRIPDAPNKKGVWRHGRIYDPQNGKTYKCLMWEDEGALQVKGYIGVTLLGRKTTWTRVDGPDGKP